jgi:hypothetical protein
MAEAEDLTEDELQMLLKHLEQFPGSDVCPVCRASTWEIIGIEAAQPYVPRRAGVDEAHVGFRLDKGVLPVVVLMCDTCGYIRSFAWNLIKFIASKGGERV